MSRRSNRNRNTVTLDRRELDRLIDAAIERKSTVPPGGTVTPLTQNVINQMMASLAPQAKTQGMFAPGAPLTPNAQITPAQGPRQWQYPVGYNIGQLPRSTETTSFDTLRNLASLYDGIGICEQVWFDLCSKPELVIKPRAALTKNESGDPISPAKLEKKYGARIAKWEDFFSKPDRKRSLKQWMRMALKDMLEIDALSIFKHKDRAGRLYALEIIDGSTIKPLLDERGMEPDPPFPAYQQFVYGVPGMQLLNNQLIYRRETERTDSAYGRSRVELIILRVNQALRKQNKDLSTFTDGNVPAGFLEPPEDGSEWKPEDLLDYQTMWDGMLAGNDNIKARIKVIPPGAKYTKTDPDDIMTAFDQFLLNVAVGAFGLTMSELAFTETVNKSSGETQEAIIYRRSMSTIMSIPAEIFTDVMHEEDGNDDLEAGWKAFEEPEDFKAKVDAWNILTTNGTQSTSQAATALGLKPMLETEPFVLTKDGPVFIKDVMDLRDTTMQAKKAGLQLSIDNPGGMQDEQGTQPGTQNAQGKQNGATSSGKGTTGKAPNGSGKPPETDSGNAGMAEKRSVREALSGQPEDAERAISAEYRRWRECAIKDVRMGKPPRVFTTDYISVFEREELAELIRNATTVEEVKRAFDLHRAKQVLDAETLGGEPLLEYNPKLDIWEPVDTESQLAALRSQGDIIEWENHGSQSGVCNVCGVNDGARRTIGEQFPSGHRLPQAHGNCQCTVKVVKQ